MISKIRKPDPKEIKPFDDAELMPLPARGQEDPNAGKSFAEVLREKREKLEASLKAQAPP